MYYLIARAPGTYNCASHSRRLYTGDTVAVAKSELAMILERHSFLVVTGCDPEELEPTTPAVGNTLPLRAPAITVGTEVTEEPESLEAISINVDNQLDLAPNAPAIEALTYIRQLSQLDPIPLYKIARIAELYPANKKIAAACAEILTTGVESNTI